MLDATTTRRVHVLASSTSPRQLEAGLSLPSPHMHNTAPSSSTPIDTMYKLSTAFFRPLLVLLCIVCLLHLYDDYTTSLLYITTALPPHAVQHLAVQSSLYHVLQPMVAPFYESYDAIVSPLLAYALLHNNVTLRGKPVDALQQLDQQRQQYYDEFHTRAVSNIKTADPYAADSTVSTLRTFDPLTMSTQHTYIDDYSIQMYDNVCLTNNAPQQLVFLGDLNHTSKIINDFKLFNPSKYRYRWQEGHTWRSLPETHLADWHHQYNIQQLEKPDVDWRWMPGTTYHQVTQDKNIGHQFHWQVWPMYMATHYAHKINASAYPLPDYLRINEACLNNIDPVNMPKDKPSPGLPPGDELLQAFTDSWADITKLLGHAVIATRNPPLTVLKAEDDKLCKHWNPQKNVPQATCFERLMIADNKHDQWFNEHAVHSLAAATEMRTDMMQYLQLKPQYPAVAYPVSRPLRVTIYDRSDASRRRLLNVDEVVSSLESHHIIRHIRDFGVLTSHEQLTLLSETDVLIAPHGAHMTYTFVMPQDSVIVELFAWNDFGKENQALSWVKNLVKIIDARHIKLTGQAQIVANFTDRPMDYDFTVDVGTVCASLRDVGVPCEIPAHKQYDTAIM